MGPTASGKTDLALALHRCLPCDLISVDSAQVYCGMDIGTSKPSSEVLRRAPHQLVNIRDPAQPYSAANFCDDALQAMQESVKNGRIPLLVGGTMLYFSALYEGLADLPAADERVRQEIMVQAEKEGWPAVHASLQAVDPQAAARIHPQDPQRLQRALEVFRVSGRTISSFHAEQKCQPFPFDVLHLALAPKTRAQLHDAIARRFHQMLADGLVEEVRQLYKRPDLSCVLPSIRSVGYRQVWSYLAGESGWEEMVERGIVATRQLAKRQMTWLRRWEGRHAVHWQECQPHTFDENRQNTLVVVKEWLQGRLPQ